MIFFVGSFSKLSGPVLKIVDVLKTSEFSPKLLLQFDATTVPFNNKLIDSVCHWGGSAEGFWESCELFKTYLKSVHQELRERAWSLLGFFSDIQQSYATQKCTEHFFKQHLLSNDSFLVSFNVFPT